MSVVLRAGQQGVSRQWQPGPPGGGECVGRGCGGPRLCVSQGATRGWKLGSSIASGSVLALLMWPYGGDRPGTPGGPGDNRKGQVGEAASWKGLSCFPWGEGGTRRVCRSRVPAWLPELAMVCGHTDVCPHSGVAAPAQESIQSKCCSSECSLSQTPGLACSVLDLEPTSIYALWSWSPEDEACWASTGLQSTSVPDSRSSRHPEGDSMFTEGPKVSWKAVALDVCACGALAGPCLPCQPARMPPHTLDAQGPHTFRLSLMIE